MFAFLAENWKIPGAIVGVCVLICMLERSIAMKRAGVITPGDKSRMRSIMKTGGLLAALAYGVIWAAK